jgi:hypothetical protein
MTAPTSALQYGYPLTCPHCEARFTREHQLASHIQTAHPEIR